MDLCARAGPAVPLHLPVVGIHRHCHHIHHHPPRWDRPAADAHSEVLLLGHQPAGVQWDQPQRSRYVHARFAHNGAGFIRKMDHKSFIDSAALVSIVFIPRYVCSATVLFKLESPTVDTTPCLPYVPIDFVDL